jgi:hypothetical protein
MVRFIVRAPPKKRGVILDCALLGSLRAAGPIVVARRSARTVVIRAAARAAAVARRSMTGKVVNKFQQLVATQFSVAVGVESHRKLDHSLGRGRARRTALGPTVVAGTILRTRAVAWFFAAPGSLGSSTGTHRIAAAIPLEATSRSVRSRSTRTTGSAIAGTGAAGALTARSGPSIVRTSPTAAAAALSTRGPQFVWRQFAVAVFVELFEGGGCVGNLLGGEDSVMVGIEGLHERIGRSALASPPLRSLRRTAVIVSRGRALRALSIVALRTPFGRLGNSDHRTERANDADRSQNVFRSKHVDLSG